MRTTLTLDDDVVAQLEDLRKTTGGSWKDVVNSTLRAGLVARKSENQRKSGPFTHPRSLGRPILPNVDDISEVLAILEGEAYR